MLKKLFTLLLFITTASPVYANSTCRLFDALSRINTSVALIVRHPNTPIMDLQMPRLRSELLFLDFESATRQLSGSIPHEDIAIMLTEIAFASAVVIAADTSDTQLVARVSDPDVDPMLKRTRQIIDAHLCASVSQAQSNAKGLLSTTSVPTKDLAPSPLSRIKGIDFKTSAAILIGTLIAIVSYFSGRSAWQRYLEKRGRRTARYDVFVPLQFATGAHDYDGLLCDVSRTGCQFAHRGEIKGKPEGPVKLHIIGRWFEGKVVWNEDNHCGVEFTSAVHSDTVHDIRDAHDSKQKRHWRKAKRRPEGRRSKTDVKEA